MTTARDMMTPEVYTVGALDTLDSAARQMRDADVGALPVVDVEGRLVGIITDRDIVVRGVAEDRDPKTYTAGELANTSPVTVSVDDSAEDVLMVMKEHQIRRVPVVEGDEMVGFLAQADVARTMEESTVGEFLESISEE